MELIEKDFKVEYEGNNYTLYYLDKKGNWKLEGYFTQLYYVLKRVYNWRKDKKYPHKEDPKEIALYAKELSFLNTRLDKLSKLIYKPIGELNERVNGKVQDSTGREFRNYTSGTS